MARERAFGLLRLLVVLVVLAVALAVPVDSGTIADDADDGPPVLTLTGSGEGTAIVHRLDSLRAQEVPFYTFIEHRLQTGFHEKLAAFLVPESFLEQERDLFALTAEGHHVRPRDYIYLYEVWNEPKTHTFAQASGQAVHVEEQDDGFWTSIVFPSPFQGTVSLAAGPHVLVIVGTGVFRYEVRLTGDLIDRGRSTLPPPTRYVLSEGDFTAAAVAGSRVLYVPLGTAVVEASVPVTLEGPSYLLVQVQNESATSAFRLVRPNGDEVPLPRKWHAASFVITPVGGGTFTEGGLYQTDLLTRDTGTWTLKIQHSAGAATDAVVLVQPLPGLA